MRVAHPITVALVDDEESVLESLRLLIGHERGVKCVGAYSDPREALAEIPLVKPDVVLLDIRMPRISGLQCAEHLKLFLPATCIIMHTGAADGSSVLQSVWAGADGYLVKPAAPGQIVEAIRHSEDKRATFSAAALEMLCVGLHQSMIRLTSSANLTSREYDVLIGFSRHARDKEIAGSLGISLRTVQAYGRRIFKKFGVHSRREAARKAFHF